MKKGQLFVKDGKYYVMKTDFVSAATTDDFWKLVVSTGYCAVIDLNNAYSDSKPKSSSYYAGDVFIQGNKAYVRFLGYGKTPQKDPSNWVEIGTVQ